MTGRMENKLKTENKILNKLDHCNKHLKNYYYYITSLHIKYQIHPMISM